MPNPQLLQYIKAQQSAGYTKDAIVAALVGAGWQGADVARAYASLVPAAPVAAMQQPVASPVRPTQPVMAQPYQPYQPLHTAQTAEPISSIPPQSQALWPWVAALVCIVAIAAAGGGYWYWQSFLVAPEPAPTEPITQAAPVVPVPVMPAPAAPTTASTTSGPSYSFAPTTSSVPAFSLSYVAALGAPLAKETADNLMLTFGTTTPAKLSLDISLFANPLEGSQTPAQYTQSTFPDAALGTLNASSRTLMRVTGTPLPAGRTLYYLFLKNDMVMTISTTGSGQAQSDTDLLLQSLHFSDPKY